ncbi:hypothetical protein ACJIZ3_005568 [Penstemon smallii]|uniref:Uncharacterized protein n=1 Tax=Penstemon smallii TaxID=265156 RepID=A0ABD3S5A8_9LAMI
MYSIGSEKHSYRTASTIDFDVGSANFDGLQHSFLFHQECNLADHYRCFQYCSLFPPDFEFERDKLVQLWIAEGFINVEITERIEDVAELYFDKLVDDKVIIPSKTDTFYGQMIYKVNALAGSAQFLTGSDYLRIDEGHLGEIQAAALHLSLQCKKFDQKIFDDLKKFKQLRTLLLLGGTGSPTKQLRNDSFLGFKLLRTLDLSSTGISELPGSIGLLESLRCLDLSETLIKLLPDSIDRLSFLQTLRLRGCVEVHALPKDLRKLINLRHLEFDIVTQLMSMPKGLRSLVKLHTLKAFIVGRNDGCGIGELKNLNNITGSFCILKLGNVLNANEAKEAAIGDKKHITKLELRWNDYGNVNSQIETEILESLQPHFGLKELQIVFYHGSKLPSWISNPSFTDLASITLHECINCDILPSIGELPSLKFLEINQMHSLKDINSLFCRNQGTRGYNAFPMLEKLILDNMLNLEKWSGLEDGDFPSLHYISIRYCPKLSMLPVLSHLRTLLYLEISHCMQLISLPVGGMPCSLESLIIRECPIISEQCLKDGEQDWFKKSHLRDIWIDFKRISLN